MRSRAVFFRGASRSEIGTLSSTRRRRVCGGPLQNTARLLVFLCVFVVSGCGARTVVKMEQAVTANETAKVASKYAGPKRRIGVVDFDNKTAYGQARLGNAASDILVTELAKTGKFIVVEREKLGKVFEEQKMQMTGAVDSAGAVQVGKILGLQAIVTGSVSQFGVRTTGSDYFITQSKRQEAECVVDVRVVDAENGQVLYADSGKGRSRRATGQVLGMGTRGGYDETIEGDALRAAVAQLVTNITSQVNKKPWSCRVADVEGQSVYIDAGSASGVEKGLELSLFQLGREIRSPATGLVIGHAETKVGEAEVESFFGDDGSIARLKNGRMPSRGDLCRLKE